MAIPSVLGTPACVLDALAFTAALALCLACVDTPIWCGLVRGLPVGKDGGGRASRGRRVGISRLPLDAAVTVLTATDFSNDAASSSSSSSSSSLVLPEDDVSDSDEPEDDSDSDDPDELSSRFAAEEEWRLELRVAGARGYNPRELIAN